MADDIETVIDGTAAVLHVTEANKLVVAFPVEAPDLKVTIDNAGDPFTGQTMQKVSAAILVALRSSGVIATRPTNPGQKAAPDPMQGHETN